jgi:FkbM family methyltransferase
MYLQQVCGHTIWEPALRKPCIVFDLGANVGAFGREMLSRFDCSVFAAEPNPQLLHRIAPHPRLTVLNVAIAGRNDIVPLHLSDNPEASSILESVVGRVVRTIDVEAVTLNEFARRTGHLQPDLIKFDIEGAEIQAIDSCYESWLASVPQLTIEFHDLSGTIATEVVHQTVARLRSLGFAPIKIWRHAWGDALFVNRSLVDANMLQFLVAKHWTRNVWGLSRVISRYADSGR